jgi:hypothetical protein
MFRFVVALAASANTRFRPRTLVALCLALALSCLGASTASAQSIPVCDPATKPAVEFVGLPSRVLIGTQEEFRFRPTGTVAETTPAAPYRVRMVNSRGRAFLEKTFDDLDHTFFITFGLNDSAARVSLGYREVFTPTAAECARTISKRVRPRRRIYFPTECGTSRLRVRPRRINVGCTAGSPLFVRMRWRRWNRAVTRGRGLVRINDCIPFCYNGHIQYLPTRVRLYRRKLCRNIERYAYTRLKYRLLRRLSTVPTFAGGKFAFPCSAYDFSGTAAWAPSGRG